jgi:hypothetical protein
VLRLVRCADAEAALSSGVQQKNGDAPESPSAAENAEVAAVKVPIIVEAGTPIKVALDSEVRVRSVGQAIHGKTIEPVYAFDKLLIPVGTVVNGKLSAIDPVPKKVRAMQAADGNFSPGERYTCGLMNW